MPAQEYPPVPDNDELENCLIFENVERVVVTREGVYGRRDGAWCKFCPAAIPRNQERTVDWQPIDTAPRDGTKILTYVPVGNYASVDANCWTTRWHSAGEWDRTSVTNPPTHWMPLPDPPRQETT